MTNDDIETANRIIKEESVSWRNLQDGDGVGGTISESWAIEAWPAIYLIDAKGVIRGRAIRSENLDSQIMALLAEVEVNDELDEPDDISDGKATGDSNESDKETPVALFTVEGTSKHKSEKAGG